MSYESRHFVHLSRSLCRAAVAGLAIVSLVACENFDQKPEVAAVAAESVAVEAEQEAVAEQLAVEAQVPPWQYDIEQLLAEADEALATDRLTTPIEDNAFDRYNAVLILQPDNQQAIEGLYEIFNRYVLLAQDAMRSGELGKARALIERARSVNRDASTLEALEQDLAQRQEQRAELLPPPEFTPDQKEVELSVERLNRRDNALVEQLQSIAIQVRDTDETLLIVARSDSEGRWIYQQMAEGVPGYRLRGDIRLGRTPKVLLLPPIE